MKIRFYIDKESELSHIYRHDVREDEVEDVLQKPSEERPGKDNSRIAIGQIGACPRMPFFLNSLSCSKNYPWNINYMPAVIFFAFLDLRKNYYSRTASYGR